MIFLDKLKLHKKLQGPLTSFKNVPTDTKYTSCRLNVNNHVYY